MTITAQWVTARADGDRGRELRHVIAPDTAERVGTFQAQAHGHPDGTMVRMTCYTADYHETARMR